MRTSFVFAIMSLFNQLFGTFATTVYVSSQSQLTSALLGGNIIYFSTDISLTQSSAYQGVTGVYINAIASLTINGQGHSLNGNSAMRCLGFNSGSTVTINDLTVTNGNADTYSGGGMYINGAATVVTMSNVNVENCKGFFQNLLRVNFPVH